MLGPPTVQFVLGAWPNTTRRNWVPLSVRAFCMVDVTWQYVVVVVRMKIVYEGLPAAWVCVAYSPMLAPARTVSMAKRSILCLSLSIGNQTTLERINLSPAPVKVHSRKQSPAFLARRPNAWLFVLAPLCSRQTLDAPDKVSLAYNKQDTKDFLDSSVRPQTLINSPLTFRTYPCCVWRLAHFTYNADQSDTPSSAYFHRARASGLSISGLDCFFSSWLWNFICRE